MKSVKSRLMSKCDEVTELSVVTQTNKSKCDKRISDFETRYEQLSISIDSQKNKLSELYTRMSECTNQLSRISEPRNSELAGVKFEIKLLKMNTHETNASLNGLNKFYSELMNESSTIRKRLTCVEKRINTISLKTNSFSQAVLNNTSQLKVRDHLKRIITEMSTKTQYGLQLQSTATTTTEEFKVIAPNRFPYLMLICQHRQQITVVLHLLPR